MIDHAATSTFHDMPLGEWIESAPNELDIDAVCLMSVIVGLRREFRLVGDDLQAASRETLEGLMERGARPIQGCSDDGGYWYRVERFRDDPGQILDGVLREWLEPGRDPDIGDIWFALPDFIEVECRPAPSGNQE